MRYILSCILFLASCCNSFASELTKEQCEKIGATHTKAGCLILSDSEKTKYKDANLYTPGKEECNCQGGTWHEKHGCLAKISEEECKSLGGEMQEGMGCIQKLTHEQCKALGGNFKANGGCTLKTQATQQPNPSFKRDCAKIRAAP